MGFNTPNNNDDFCSYQTPQAPMVDQVPFAGSSYTLEPYILYGYYQNKLLGSGCKPEPTWVFLKIF